MIEKLTNNQIQNSKRNLGQWLSSNTSDLPTTLDLPESEFTKIIQRVDAANFVIDSLTSEQVDFMKSSFLRWLTLRRNKYSDVPNIADVDHSALLQRLLSGKAALDIPPPLYFSYPWYELVEQGFGEVQGVAVWPPNQLNIAGDLNWSILEQTADFYHVRYRNNLYEATVKSTTLHSIGITRGGTETEYHFPGWRIELTKGKSHNS